MFPWISIIVPVYNTESYLPECLDSIERQTYENIEVILVDDGSTDSSGRICDQYAEKDARFQVIHTENRGLVSARKTGLACAKGDYIGFVDSDDWIEKTMYESLSGLLQDTQADMVCCGAMAVLSDKQRKCYNCVKEGVYFSKNLPYLYSTMIFDEAENGPGIFQSICSKLFKKDLLKRCLIPVDNEITYGEDAAVVYSCCLNAKTIIVINEAYYYYRQNSLSICGKKDIEIFKKVNLFYEYMNEMLYKYPAEWGLKQQLKCYMLYFIRIGIEKNFYWRCKNRYQLSYKQLLDSKRIVLYGAGNVGTSYYEQLKEQDIWEIVLWVDRKCAGMLKNGCVISPVASLIEKEYDKVLIAVREEKMALDIRKQLFLLGVEDEKIVWIQPIVKSMEWQLEMKMNSG